MIFSLIEQEIYRTPFLTMANLLSSPTHTSVPRFMQLTDLLQREILGGQYLPGDRLPPESQLAAELGVAVGTLRKALAELESRSVVERRQGSGTYVSKQDSLAEADRAAIYQFFRLERFDGGGLPGATVLNVDLVACPDTARLLGEDARSKHWRIRRIRTLDQAPVAAEQICIASRHAKQLDPNTLSESLYEHYRKTFNQWVTRVEDSVGVEGAPSWFEQVSKRDCGVVHRTAWNQQDEIVEVSTTWFDPAQCCYTARWS